MVIDYVRVYERKGGYKEMEASCKEPVAKYSPKRSEAGNIIHNGDFSASESFANDGIEWCYLQTQGGQGNASIKDGAICIETKNAGSVDYSIQLVQGEIPLEKGHTYTYSFDAWSDKPRKMTTAFKEIEAWTAYIQKEVQLTKKKKHFEYKFTVTGDSNDNARLEYNIDHIVEFTIEWFEGLKAKYGEAFPRRTVIRGFDAIEATKVAEANAKILAWCSFPLDPTFEDGALKNTDGVYQDVFDGLSYQDYSVEEAAQVLADGITAVLAK